eukprot:3143819-Lingulodinium_polyedra.AAC.1
MPPTVRASRSWIPALQSLGPTPWRLRRWQWPCGTPRCLPLAARPSRNRSLWLQWPRRPIPAALRAHPAAPS